MNNVDLKFGPDVLLEIISIIRDALVNGKDASDALRSIVVEVNQNNSEVNLSKNYKR